MIHKKTCKVFESNNEGLEQSAIISNKKEGLQEKICLESISTHMVDSGPQQKTPLGRTLILFPWRYLKERDKYIIRYIRDF